LTYDPTNDTPSGVTISITDQRSPKWECKINRGWCAEYESLIRFIPSQDD